MNCTVTTTYDNKETAAFQRAASRTVQRGQSGSTRFLMGLLSVFCFAMGGYLWAADRRLLVIPAAALGGLCLAAALFYHQLIARASRTAAPPEDITFTFSGDGFTARIGAQARQHSYEEVFALCDCGSRLYLFLRGQGGCILDKSRFQGAAPEALIQFLTAQNKSRDKKSQITVYTLS